MLIVTKNGMFLLGSLALKFPVKKRNAMC